MEASITDNSSNNYRSEESIQNELSHHRNSFSSSIHNSSTSSSNDSSDFDGKAWSINTNDALDLIQQGIKLDYTDTFAPRPSPVSSVITVTPKVSFENLNSFEKDLINDDEGNSEYEIAKTKFVRNNTIKRLEPQDLPTPDDDHTNDFKIMREKSIMRHSRVKSQSDLLALNNDAVMVKNHNNTLKDSKRKVGSKSATDLIRLHKAQQLKREANGNKKNASVSFANSKKNKSTTSFLSLFTKNRSKMSVDADEVINGDQKAEFNSQMLNSIRWKDKTAEDLKAHKREGFLQRRKEKRQKKKDLRKKKEILLKTYQDSNEFPDIPPAFLLNPDAKLLHVPDKVLENAEKTFPQTIKRGTAGTEDFLDFSYVPFSRSNLNLQDPAKRYSEPVISSSRMSQPSNGRNSMFLGAGSTESQNNAKRNTLPVRVRNAEYPSINSVVGNKENIGVRKPENSKSHSDLNDYGDRIAASKNLRRRYSNDTSNYTTNVKIMSTSNNNRMKHHPKLRRTGVLNSKAAVQVDNVGLRKPKKKHPEGSSTSSFSQKYHFRSNENINNAIMDYYSSGEEEDEEEKKNLQKNLALKNDIFSDEDHDEDEQEGFLVNKHYRKRHSSPLYPTYKPSAQNHHSHAQYSVTNASQWLPVPNYNPPPVPSDQDLPYPKDILDSQLKSSSLVQKNAVEQNLHIYNNTVRNDIPKKTKFTLGSLDDDDYADDDDDEESFYDAASIQFNGASIDEFKNPAAFTTGMIENNIEVKEDKSSKKEKRIRAKQNLEELNRMNTFNSTAVRVNFK